MSPSPMIRFARWAALGVGIIYGYNRYNYLQAYHDDKKAIAAKKAPPPSTTGSTDGMITDPNNPDFDLEKLLNSLDTKKAPAH